MPVQLCLLGRPRWGQQVLGADKTYLLLYYLAFRADWSSREELAFLFWPDRDDRAARRNLRQLLHRLKRIDCAVALEVDAQGVRYTGDTDVRPFRDAIGAGRWVEALRHYSGELLEGVSAPDAPAYDSWLAFEREALRASWREAALHVAADLEATERHGEAAALLKDMWLHDRFDEALLQAYLRNAYLAGDRDQALVAFKAFRELLRDELAMRPMASTLDLFDAISRGATVRPAASPSRGRASLPAPTTPFVGRDDERADVHRILARSEGRMIAVVGPGGVGKTRLAIQVAREQVDRFEHGVFFVPLADRSRAEEMIAAVADAMEFSLFGARDPQRQVFEFLADREVLLVLDNLEHVVEGSAVLVELLAAAPRVKAIATSRLEVRHEQHVWHYRLQGLPYGDAERDAPESDAGQLFVQSARRASPRFELRRRDVPHLHELCRLTAGLPLALELAAAWAWQLSVREIVEEVRRNLDLLESNDEHEQGSRGIRAVYEHSWSLLSPDEQSVLGALSVFRGGFTTEAARSVASASLYVLLSLVGKSLLQRDASERYDMHPLLRRYAYQKLDERPEADRVRVAHARYYAREAERIWSLMDDGRETAWLARMTREIENLKEMWAWAVRHEDREIVADTVRHLTAFFGLRSRYREGMALLSAALDVFTNRSPAKAKLLARMGNLYLRQEGVRNARPLLEEALESFEQGDDAFEFAFTLMNLAAVDRNSGDLDGAESRFRTSLELFRDLGHRKAVGQTVFNLGMVAFDRGDLSEAGRFFDESRAIADEVADVYAGSYARVRLADTALESGDVRRAAALYRESLGRFRDLDHTAGSAHARLGLARIALREGAAERAEELLRLAVATYEEVGSWIGVSEAMAVMGVAAAARGDHRVARTRHLRALDAALETMSTPAVIHALAGSIDEREVGRACALACAYALVEQPAATARTRRELRARVADLERQASPDDRAAARRQATSLTLDEIASLLTGRDDPGESPPA